MNHWSYVLAAVLGGALGAVAVMAAAQTVPVRDAGFERRPVAVWYSCENVPAFDPEEHGAIRQLREDCRVAQEALLLLQTWERDPMAGVVLEP